LSTARAQPDSRWPELGFGVGLRAEHYEDVLDGRARADWFEAISENYMDTGGRPLSVLEHARRDVPVALHGVALSIGSSDPLDRTYLARLKALADRIEPALVTDHLCWAGVDGRSLYDLLPLPYTEEALAHVAARVCEVQDFLGRRILLENASTYVEYRCSQMPEAEFLAALAERTDCGVLLDLNNVHVSCTNHGWDARAYVDAIPVGRVGQFHLAGFSDMGGWLFDTHSAPACERVWELYEHAVERFGRVATLFEWDASIPPFDEVRAQAERARRIAEQVYGRTSDGRRDAAAQSTTVARIGHSAA
jgi:uncharacterized protein (UPF0276 family)